eukprot:3746170-Rhodomonas_salina.4
MLDHQRHVSQHSKCVSACWILLASSSAETARSQHTHTHTQRQRQRDRPQDAPGSCPLNSPLQTLAVSSCSSGNDDDDGDGVGRCAWILNSAARQKPVVL